MEMIQIGKYFLFPKDILYLVDINTSSGQWTKIVLRDGRELEAPEYAGIYQKKINMVLS